jgi:hypothetical protein
MQAEGDREEGDQHEVHGDEPQRADDEEDGPTDPLEVEEGAEERSEPDPHEQERGRWYGQPPEP